MSSPCLCVSVIQPSLPKRPDFRWVVVEIDQELLTRLQRQDTFFGDYLAALHPASPDGVGVPRARSQGRRIEVAPQAGRRHEPAVKPQLGVGIGKEHLNLSCVDGYRGWKAVVGQSAGGE